MDLTPSEDQRLILEAVRGLAERARLAAPRWDAEDRIDREAMGWVAELGLGGLFLEESQGGAGFGLATAALALEALAEGSAALALRLVAHAAAALPDLAGAGLPTSELEALGSGGSWLARASGVERRGRTLHGEARWVVSGRDAGLLVVTTTEGEVHAVHGNAEGVTRTAAEPLGMRGAGLAHLRFEGVEVASPVGRLDPTRLLARDVEERLALAAIGAGIGRAALASATAYALERKQFGRPIAEFQAVQWMIADAATEVDAAALLVLRAGLLLDQGTSAEAEARSALVASAEAALLAAQKAIQIHGGYGFVREFPVERLARDARYLGMALGGRDRDLERLGHDLLG